MPLKFYGVITFLSLGKNIQLVAEMLYWSKHTVAPERLKNTSSDQEPEPAKDI